MIPNYQTNEQRDKKIDNPNIKYLPFLLTVIKTVRR